MIRAYLNHLLTAKTAHSLHSPFVLELYTQCIRSSKNYYAFQDIEKIRQQLLQNNQAIKVTDLGAGSRKNNGNIRKISTIARHSVSSRKTSQLLFKLVNWFQPTHIVELGTSLGINTLYLAKARQASQVITLEGCDNIAEIARQNFKKAQCNNIEVIVGNIDQTLKDCLLKTPSLDFVFFDANHRKAPTLQYFEHCLPQAHTNSIFVFDDIYWSHEMQEVWQQIQKHPQVTLTIDLFNIGLVFFKEMFSVQHLKLHF